MIHQHNIDKSYEYKSIYNDDYIKRETDEERFQR